MNILILLLFFIVETTLLVFALEKSFTKKSWSSYRLLANGIEFVLFLVSLITPSVALNIRFKLLFIILIMKLIFSGIRFLICINNEKSKSVVSIILCYILSCITILFALIPSFIFADYRGLEPTGTHEVASTHFILIDNDREDPFEGPGSKREVPVYAFYPADAASDSQYPLVVFSHGSFGYYQNNMSAYNELASHGYVVLSLEHPHHSIFTKNSTGELITVDQQFYADAMGVNSDDASEEYIFETTSAWIDLRVSDMDFALDSIEEAKITHSLNSSFFSVDANPNEILDVINMTDITHVGLFGHSLGGATAVTVGRHRDEVAAVIDIDGTLIGEEIDYKDGKYTYIEEPYPVPLLCIDNEEHHTQSDELGVLYVNNYVCSKAKNATRVWFKGSGHMNFTDLALFSPFIASSLGTGSINSEDCIVQLNSIILDYFDYYLKGEGQLTLNECYH